MSTATATKGKGSKTPRKATKKATEQSANGNGKPSQLDTAYQLLSQAKKPMNCKELVELMTKKGLWESSAATPHLTLSTSIIREMRKGKDSRFKRTAPGLFTAKA